jgi:hypothetical protein
MRRASLVSLNAAYVTIVMALQGSEEDYHSRLCQGF